MAPATVLAAELSVGTTAERLRELVGRTSPVALAVERTLPLLPALRGLVAGEGLRRGSTLTVTGMGAGGAGGGTSLALALVAAASQAGSWAAVVGIPALHPVAAAALCLSLERVALVPVVPAAQWATVVAALLDALDVVVVAVPERLRAPDARRLQARAKERGAVLVPVAGAGTPTRAWVEGADVRLRVVAARWHGLEEGHGLLRARAVTVSGGGRGVAGRERTATLWLPGPDGKVAPAAAEDARPTIEPVFPALPATGTQP